MELLLFKLLHMKRRAKFMKACIPIYWIVCLMVFAPLVHGEESSDSIALLQSNGVDTQTAGLIAYLNLLQPDEKRQADIVTLITELGSAKWHERETASGRLVLIGEPAKAKLTEALTSQDPEVRWRAKRILESPDFSSESHARRALTRAVLKVLKSRGDGQAVPVLLASIEVLSDEIASGGAYEALWASVDTSHVDLLKRAIAQGSTTQRAAAVVALEISAAATGPEAIEAAIGTIRPLLTDIEPVVRLAAARALLDRDPQAAVHSLVQLTSEDGLDIVWQADALLRLKTGEQIKPGATKTLGGAWKQWVNAQKPRLTLTRKVGEQRLDLTAGRTWLEETFMNDQALVAKGYGRFQYESDNQGQAKVSDGKLRIEGNQNEGDQRLFITSQQMIGRDRWTDELEIRVQLAGEIGNNYGWHIGVSVGRVKVLFHPGESKGYFRAETTDKHEQIIPNRDLSFAPAAGVMHEMILLVKKTNTGAEFEVTVNDGNGGPPYNTRFKVTADQLGDFSRIGLERSGRAGGDAVFDSISIRLMD